MPTTTNQPTADETDYKAWQRQAVETQFPVCQLTTDELQTIHYLDRDNWPCREPGCSGHTRWEHRMMEQFPPPGEGAA